LKIFNFLIKLWHQIIIMIDFFVLFALVQSMVLAHYDVYRNPDKWNKLNITQQTGYYYLMACLGINIIFVGKMLYEIILAILPTLLFALLSLVVGMFVANKHGIKLNLSTE